MISSVQDRNKAIELRKRGWTYNEIQRELSVAKSSLSLWFKDLHLTEREMDQLRSRKDSNRGRGRAKAAASNRANRLERQKILISQSEHEFLKRRWDPLFLVGVALYWSQGVKTASSVQFVSSDPEMVKTFVMWLEKFENAPRINLAYRLFIHTPYYPGECENFWSKHLNISLSCFKKTIYKQTSHPIKPKSDYKGALKVIIPKSTVLLLKMRVWQNMLASTYGK